MFFTKKEEGSRRPDTDTAKKKKEAPTDTAKKKKEAAHTAKKKEAADTAKKKKEAAAAVSNPSVETGEIVPGTRSLQAEKNLTRKFLIYFPIKTILSNFRFFVKIFSEGPPNPTNPNPTN